MASQQQAALVSVGPGSSLPWPVVDAFLQHAGQQPSSLVFFNPHADASSAPGVFGAAGLTCVAAPFSRGHNRAAFAAFATALAPGARLCVFDPQRDVARSQDISKDLLLSGFTDSSVHECSGTVLIQASKPKWDVGAKAMLKRPVAATTATTTATPAIAPLAPKTWGVNVDDNDELMDDEELLTEEDKKPVDAKAAAAASGCATSKKACKNCSCGRAELELQQEQGVKLTTDMLENPVSACGSCYLGDAFRCASCPYKGLPAFEPGKKIELSKDLLVADV